MLYPLTYREERREDSVKKYLNGEARNPYVFREDIVNFGDLHVMGRDGFSFFTETKCVTSTWFSEEAQAVKAVDTWDVTMAALSD